MQREIIWQPSKDFIENSNIARFMKKHNIKTYKQLVKRSQQDMEWFWDAVVRDLNIQWYKPYTKVLDIRKGPQWARWFPDGKINIAYNCVDRHTNSHRRNKLSLLWEGENFEVKKLTYRELYIEVNKFASALKRLGIKKGDIIGIYMPMIPEIVIALLSVAKIGAIMLPIFSGYAAPAIAVRLIDADAKILITCDGFYRRGKIVNMKQIADEAVKDCETVKNVIVVKRTGTDIPWNENKDLWYHELIEKEEPYCKTEPVPAETPYYLAYTSGTTGKPKGCVHPQAAMLIKVTEEIAYPFDLRDEDIFFWFTDMGWMMGPWEVIGVSCLGGTLFLFEGAPDYPTPDRLWATIAKHGITTFGFSPSGIRTLMRYGDDLPKKHDLSCLRILGSTGEPLTKEAYLWFFNNIGGKRCPIINISGGTDIVGCFLSPLPIAPLKISTLQGPALGFDVDVFDEKGKPIRGQVGELVCKKPGISMTRGLWKDPQRYIETYWARFKNVWVHGDWASIDKDGYWFLHGRSDDTIKVAGKRVGPAEVETAVTSHPAVLESAAIGVPDPIKGEDVVCFVRLKPDYSPSDELREQIKEEVVKYLGKTLKPKDIKFVSDLPKTRNAKIMRRLIRAKFLGQELGDTSSLENPDALEEITKAI